MSCSKNFTAGNIAKHINAWKALTSDERILSIVMGCQLEFVQPPCQTKVPRVTNVSSREAQIISCEINKLLSKGSLQKPLIVLASLFQPFLLGPKKMAVIASF